MARFRDQYARHGGQRPENCPDLQIPVFADADTGYGDAISTHYTLREYIQAGIAGAHIEDQTFPPKSGPRRRCISIQEMVAKLRAAMDAKQATMSCRSPSTSSALASPKPIT